MTEQAIKKCDVKQCSTCGETKSVSQFHRSRKSSDGLISQCKPCKNAAIRLSEFRSGRRRSPDLVKQDLEPIDPNRTHKICNVCQILKPLEEFYKESRTTDGYQTRCKQCQKSSAQISYGENKPHVLERNAKKYDSEARRERTLKEGYGISSEIYEQMLQLQNGKCAICESSEPKHNSGYFVVDHCHESGSVRGLLCGECNFMIGKAKDNISTLESAINYLKKSNADISVS